LNGSVDPNGSALTDCHFDYGPTAAYGASVPCETLPGAGTSPAAVTAPLEGLAPSTTYHFRLRATGAGGSSAGADAVPTTPASSAACTDGLGRGRFVDHAVVGGAHRDREPERQPGRRMPVRLRRDDRVWGERPLRSTPGLGLDAGVRVSGARGPRREHHLPLP